MTVQRVIWVSRPRSARNSPDRCGVDSRSTGSAGSISRGAIVVEDIVEFLRAQREKRDALIINDPQPFTSIADIWGSAAQMATVGLFVLALVTCLYFCRPLLLPTLAAILIGTTFAPLINLASRHGVSPWVMAVAIVALMMAAAGLLLTMLILDDSTATVGAAGFSADSSSSNAAKGRSNT